MVDAGPARIPPRRWTYLGRAAHPRPGELEGFQQVLSERLRLGQAAPVSFAIVWGAGPLPVVHIEAGDPPSARWWGTSVVPAYPSLNWRTATSPSDEAPAVLVGAPIASSDCPFRSGAAPPWSDSAVSILASVSAGWSVRWDLRGGGAPETAPVLRAGEALRWLPPNLRSPLPVARPVRETDDLREVRRLQPKWAVRVSIRGPTGDGPTGGVPLARGLAGLTRQDGGNGVTFRTPRRWWPAVPREFLLSSHEVLGLLPTPWSPWAMPRDEHPPGTRPWRIGVDVLGRPVTVPVEPGNGRHVLLAGETGMGKSTLLVRMAVTAAHLGTVILLDPLGGTGRDLLGALARDRAPPPTWIAPLDSPVPTNALGAARGSPAESERAIADLVSALRRVRSARFESAPFWGPRLEEATHWALTAAAGLPNGSLVDAERLLSDPHADVGRIEGAAAEQAIRALRDRARGRPEELEGALRMMAEANRTTVLRELLSTPNAPWGAQDALAPSAVTVITGDAGAVGVPTTRTLLALYLALLASALLARTPSGPVFLFLDEASWYAHESLAELLRVGRRWGLHVIVATQSLEAFPPDLREALWTNTADQIRFRGSPAEPRDLERWGTELTTERLVGLPRGVAVGLFGKGREIRWISTAPLAPPMNPTARLNELAERSKIRWGSPTPTDPGPPGPADDIEGPGSPLRRGPETAGVWALLRDRCRAGAPGSVTVELSELRTRPEIPDSALREAGRLLAAAGVLRSERGRSGTCWVLDRDRFLEWDRTRERSGGSDPSTGSAR